MNQPTGFLVNWQYVTIYVDDDLRWFISAKCQRQIILNMRVIRLCWWQQQLIKLKLQYCELYSRVKYYKSLNSALKNSLRFNNILEIHAVSCFDHAFALVKARRGSMFTNCPSVIILSVGISISVYIYTLLHNVVSRLAFISIIEHCSEKKSNHQNTKLEIWLEI